MVDTITAPAIEPPGDAPRRPGISHELDRIVQHMIIDVASTDVVKVYKALVGVVVPRPIAWVTTVDLLGRVNLAPFSFFNAFGANPPIVVFSPTLRRDGTKKDTLLNLEMVGEFVVNAAVEEVAQKLNATSAELPRAKRSGLRRFDSGAFSKGTTAARRRVAGAHGMPVAADHVDGGRANRSEPGHRRDLADSHR